MNAVWRGWVLRYGVQDKDRRVYRIELVRDAAVVGVVFGYGRG